MTDSELVQQEKDVLYGENKTTVELNAHIVKLQRMQADLHTWSEHLRMFHGCLENLDLPIERAITWRDSPDIDLKEVVTACDEAIAVRTRLDSIRSQKKKLGL